MENLIYKKFILGTQDEAGSSDLFYKAIDKGLGGVIFFTRDIKSKDQFIDLVNNIKNCANRPIFLSIDQEGGRVERTENIHARYLSPKFAYQKGDDFLRNQTEKIAKELKSYGLNLNFAPCADVNTNPNNPIIGERAFADNPKDVSKATKLVVQEYRKNGIIPCLKHFPGHGDANADSHLTLPQIDLPMNVMEDIHIKPFKDNLDVEMIMVAHLYCTCFDGKNVIPSSLSKNVVGYLRNVLKYEGVVISDDMVMKGVQQFGSFEACKMAINAGVDMFIFRNTTKDVLKLIDELVEFAKNNADFRDKLEKSEARIQKLREKFLY